jgi:predicted PurR-regulated permease PerM
VGVTNIIPDIGPIIGAIPGILIYLAISPADAFSFFIIILCLQQFDGMILGPKILGEKLGIRPIIILPSVIIGGHYFGIVGMVLGVPLATVISIYLNKYIENKKERNKNNE